MWPLQWAIWSSTCCDALPALHRAGNQKGRRMTNRIALVLAFVILGALTIDYFIYANEYLLFLAKKMADLIEWLAFWR
jgi:hypothetical protein